MCKKNCKKQCSNCAWWYDDGICCNGDSEYRADWTEKDFVCKEWEEKEC